MARPLFQLGPRLAACAGFVRQDAVAADIGTDHAYLPIWLLKSGRVSYAYAADVREKPLDTARRNAAKYQVEDRLQTVLGNGLENIPAQKVTDIIIAGMGGLLITDILKAAAFLKNEKIRLILQPMKDDSLLRIWLNENGFLIEEEKPVCDAGRVYTVLRAGFSAGAERRNDLLFPYMGCLQKAPETRLYAQKVVRILSREAEGAVKTGDGDRGKAIMDIIREINAHYIEGEAG